MAPKRPEKAGGSPNTKAISRGGIAALIAAALAVAIPIATPIISNFESGGKQYLKAYPDVVGVWTICDGETLGVKKGDTETAAGCKLRLDKRIAQDFAPPVLACAPGLIGKPYPTAASISLAYNIGVSAFCGSTAVKRFNAGDIKGGCDAFLSWKMATQNGKKVVVQGLLNRRNAERTICLRMA